MTLPAVRRAVRAATPALALATAALTAVLAACSDGPTSPAADRVAASAPAPSVGPAYAAASTAASQVLAQTGRGDTVQTTFKLGTNAQIPLVVPLGNSSWIVFPSSAASVCDSTAGYGPAVWDSPCKAATYPITVSAKTYHDGRTGKLVSEFHPALRFVPGVARPVRLYLKNSTHTPADAIWYCPETGSCVNDAVADPSVASGYDSNNQWIYRVLKHFSGYTVLVN